MFDEGLAETPADSCVPLGLLYRRSDAMSRKAILSGCLKGACVDTRQHSDSCLATNNGHECISCGVKVYAPTDVPFPTT